MREKTKSRPERRNLFLFGNLEDDVARDVVSELVRHPDVEFTLFINCPGGGVYPSLAIVNAVRQHGRVDTFCLGVAMSAGADVLAAGRRRYVVPHAIAMIHQTSWELEWQFTSNLTRNAQHMERLNDLVMTSLAQGTGRSLEEVKADAREDHYLYGQEIIDYGLADEIWEGGWEPFREETPRPAGDERQGRRVTSLE
jgi:ATP-dependent Clp protease protease subunit